MHIIRVDSKKPSTATIRQAVAIMKSGGLVVYPTETAYALGCDAKSVKGVKRIFSVKKRDASKPLPMIAASSAMAKRFLKLDRYGAALAEAFWPGPLTLVAPSSIRLAPGIASKKGEISIRVSPNIIAVALSKALGRPIVSTSANLSGGPTPYDAPAVLASLGSMPDVILDSGPLSKTAVSTIVRPGHGVVEILREGPISEEDLHQALMKTL